MNELPGKGFPIQSCAVCRRHRGSIGFGRGGHLAQYSRHAGDDDDHGGCPGGQTGPAAGGDSTPAAENPASQADHNQQDHDEGDQVGIRLEVQHPDQPYDGRHHEKPHELFERLHPCAGSWNIPEQGGNRRKSQVGQGHAQAQESEDRQGLGRRLRQGVAQGHAHERRGARRGHDRGQDAAHEGTAETASRIHPAADSHQGSADFKDAEKAQSEHEDDDRQDDDKGRRLELESPAQFFSPGPQGDQNRSQREKGQQDARGENQPVLTDLSRVFSRLVYETEHLDGQHGQHAGHQVEDQSADEGEEEGLPQARHQAAGTCRKGGRDRRRQVIRVDGADGKGPLRSGAAPSILGHQHARDQLRFVRIESGPPHGQQVAGPRFFQVLGRDIVDQVFIVRVELYVGQIAAEPLRGRGVEYNRGIGNDGLDRPFRYRDCEILPDFGKEVGPLFISFGRIT